MSEESDRAAVILAAAGLDELLLHALRARLRPVSGRDDLLESEGPLSTFSARIKAAYRVGLIDENFASALNLVRKLRNSFAHGLHGQKLADAPHRERVIELMRCFLNTPKLVAATRARVGGRDASFRDVVVATGLMMLQIGTELQRGRIAPVDLRSGFTIAPRDYTPGESHLRARGSPARSKPRRRQG